MDIDDEILKSEIVLMQSKCSRGHGFSKIVLAAHVASLEELLKSLGRTYHVVDVTLNGKKILSYKQFDVDARL